MGAYIGNLINAALGLANAEGNTGEQFAGSVLGLVGGAYGGPIGVGASMNVGAEELFTTGDRTASSWTYYGPGVSFSASSIGGSLAGSVSGSVTFYGGVCWGVPTYDTYAGGFISLSLGAGSAVFGFAFNFFWSDSNPAQNGYNIGLTVSVPFGNPGLSPTVGISYVNYVLGTTRPWFNPVPILFALSRTPGMQMWPLFLAYKWSVPKG